MATLSKGLFLQTRYLFKLFDMIINIPKPKDFERQSVQYLMQALNLIYEKERELEHFDEDEQKKTKDEYWAYHQGILSNSLALLFLSLENYLKREICNVSAFLLLADAPTKWKSSKNTKQFNELFIHQFDDLLVLYLELGLGSIDEYAVVKLEELRKKRNQVTHAVLIEKLTSEYVMNIFYTFVRYIWGPKVWWDKLKDHIFNEPIFGEYDSDIERAHLIFYIDFFVSYFGLKRTGEILGINLKQRRYYCPYCDYWLNYDAYIDEAKYAILFPNKPKSTNLYYIVCDQNYKVSRRNCVDEDCRGNVIGVIDKNETCLTCRTIQRNF
jgi:hypothetical protein